MLSVAGHQEISRFSRLFTILVTSPLPDPLTVFMPGRSTVFRDRPGQSPSG